jgi:hypothetical protein
MAPYHQSFGVKVSQIPPDGNRRNSKLFTEPRYRILFTTFQKLEDAFFPRGKPYHMIHSYFLITFITLSILL